MSILERLNREDFSQEDWAVVLTDALYLERGWHIVGGGSHYQHPETRKLRERPNPWLHRKMTRDSEGIPMEDPRRLIDQYGLTRDPKTGDWSL